MNSINMFIVITLLVAIIFVLMNVMYQVNYNHKIEKYLLNCEILEKEVLKTIFHNKDKSFPLTKNSNITKKFLDLNILSKLKDDEKNSLHAIYKLNMKIFYLVNKKPRLKEVYLSNGK
ncbi:hypothetical protein [Candidatus Phytoplasma melaleucae]|uniref:Uncharacterized protein n=1 Tax=Candidatus Phytoplasma melaleucae TaxID=2982630 RepID=A0ABT9DE03_9MOLU|nr:hypothetical protein ['Melaleuca sp.' phytoplasma]MDO8168245.1 hypothetical protein ['Melaleuca sp.' phytoplasma]